MEIPINMKLDSFRELENNPNHDINNEITTELYENIISLYGTMRVKLHIIYHSHASLLSKLVKQIPNACNGVNGYLISIVNLSFPTRPNCKITLSFVGITN